MSLQLYLVEWILQAELLPGCCLYLEIECGLRSSVWVQPYTVDLPTVCVNLTGPLGTQILGQMLFLCVSTPVLLIRLTLELSVRKVCCPLPPIRVRRPEWSKMLSKRESFSLSQDNGLLLSSYSNDNLHMVWSSDFQTRLEPHHQYF